MILVDRCPADRPPTWSGGHRPGCVQSLPWPGALHVAAAGVAVASRGRSPTAAGGWEGRAPLGARPPWCPPTLVPAPVSGGEDADTLHGPQSSTCLLSDALWPSPGSRGPLSTHTPLPGPRFPERNPL